MAQTVRKITNLPTLIHSLNKATTGTSKGGITTKKAPKKNY